MCFDMTFNTENATNVQGTEVSTQKKTATKKVNSNAKNSDETEEKAVVVSAIDAMLAKHSDLITNSSVSRRDTVDWFIPEDEGSSVNATYAGIANINGNNQILLEVFDTKTYVRLPDDLGAFVGGRSTGSQSFGSCKRLVNILKDVGNYYNSKLGQLFDIAYATYMVADNYVDQKGLIFDRNIKDNYGNMASKKLVWTMDNRKAMQGVINDFVAYISAEGIEHPEIALNLDKRSRLGYSSIISEVE